MRLPPLQAFSLLALAALACGGPSAPVDFSGPVAEWREYGGDKGGLRFSPLTQITPENVGDLELAWVHRNGDISDGSDGTTRTSFNVTPIVVGDRLYFCTGFNRVFALDAETGVERWSFDPEQELRLLKGPYPRVCRGVAYWEGPAPETRCGARIYTGTLDAELIALDAATGAPCPDFGEGGRVALREGVIGGSPPWEYYVTSPPIVVRDVVVVGALVADNVSANAPSGVVRAFDVRSGELRWAWDPVPPGEAPGDPDPSRDYRAGTANVWSILSADEARGLVFVPTGNAAPDYYGGERKGLDYYSSSTVALDAATGVPAWRFQTVHHDLWDYDVAPQPTLYEFPGASGPVPAVVQATKMGLVFLLHRETGEPLFPVEERPVPQGAVPGETLSPTQPFPTHVPPLHPLTLTPDDAYGFTFWDRGQCAKIIGGLRSEGLYTPPSFEGTLQYPGSAGGANWGGVSIDPLGHRMFVNQMRVPSVVWLVTNEEYERLSESGELEYPNELYPMEGTPYALKRGPLLSPLGAPCNPPPWGTLTAVDLESGEVLWESVLGTTRDQAPWPLWFASGAPNLGGSIVTASGLVFIGATTDKFLRAFDAETGEEVWTERLPFTANATPLTYRLRPDSKQYVVVAAGGHGWSEPGDSVMAFALPD